MPRPAGEPSPEATAASVRADSLELLDYPAVRRRLAGLTTFFDARRLALELIPSYDPDEVQRLQGETSEARALLDEVGHAALHTDSDISDALARAELEGVLTGAELAAVAATVAVLMEARALVRRAGGRTPFLADLVSGIPELDELRGRIVKHIGPDGEVADDATPALRAVRRLVSRAYQSVTETLAGVMQAPRLREALQDQVISIRGERLVVQVKSGMRHRVQGIVHDASNTGATLFVEPFATVELCNAWRELVLEEEREIARILRELSALVGAAAGEVRRGSEIAARLDLVLARGRLSAQMGGVRPVASRQAPPPGARASRPQETPPHPSFPRKRESIPAPPPDAPRLLPGTRHASSPDAPRLLGARHPLLGADAVPVTLAIGPGWTTLLITGPNTGGKTVAMKTLGLLALMHQSGLHLPADEGSSLPVFDGIYADVGDRQSIERSVSTFSSHMRRVIDILGAATPSSLVLLDELGTSTDPEEGAALAKAILSHLTSSGVCTVATTHHRTVAAHAEAAAGMMNASVRLDTQTLAPTYHLTIGIPGRSYAMSVAARLGLPADIMESAESLIEPRHLRFEDWLNELQEQRDALQRRLVEVEEARGRTAAVREEIEAQLDYLVERRDDILDGVRREAVARGEEARRRLRRAEAALSWKTSGDDVAAARERTAWARRELEKQPPPRRAATGSTGVSPAMGDAVRVRGLNLEGVVTSLQVGDEEAEVVVGNVRLRVERTRLSRVETPAEGACPDPPVVVDLGPALDSIELDLRGLRVEEALVRLEEFMDQALRDGLSTVRIVHGRGTGALREAVRDHLDRHPLAREYAPEPAERGGNGATTVELA